VIAGAVIAAVVAVALIALVAVIIVRRQNAAASKRLSTGSLDASSSEMVSTTVPEYINPAYLGVSSGVMKGDYADPNGQAVGSTQYTDEGF